MSISDHYTQPEEQSYLRTFSYHTPYFAPGELSKIENYLHAVADNFIGWVIHHRLELNDDGTINKPRETLILENLYYCRPADELIFLTKSDHCKLHIKASRSSRQSVKTSDSTKQKQSKAKLTANNTEARYKVVSDMVQRDETLSFSDYQFYRRYCNRNGIEFTGAKVDKTGTLRRVDVPKIPSEKQTKPRRIDLSNQRYDQVIERLNAGEEITKQDYDFLRSHCARYHKDMPELTVRPTTCILRKFNPNATKNNSCV